MLKKNQQVPQRIMIIDDDPFSVMLSKIKLRKIVDEDGIIEFHDTQSALEYLVQHLGKNTAMVPDLILLEVMMNDASGWDFITHFNELTSKYEGNQMQLVVLTSSQFFSDYRRASGYDTVKGFMMKPFQTDLLLEVYQNAASGKVYSGNEVFQTFIV
jgi:CheY-like chemotaxis protein